MPPDQTRCFGPYRLAGPRGPLWQQDAVVPLPSKALGRLGRGPDSAALVAALRQYAPTWLAQLPALCRPADLAALQRLVQDTTHTRMLRELAEALEALTAARPLVLVLEDLHWSDASTVALLALLARRREAARVLVLGTYRPVDVIVHAHPLHPVKQELVAHGQARELPLGGLGLEAVRAYLAQRADLATTGQEDVAAWVLQRTEGHPLFMVQMVDVLAQQGGRGAPAVPPRLRDLLEAQLGRLGTTEQQVLEGGSVAGAEFAAASVATGLQTTPEAVEAVGEGLARQGQFLEDRGLVEWPAGTVSGRYGWRQALYQEVVYQRLGAGCLAQMHQSMQAVLATGQGLSYTYCRVVLADAAGQVGEVEAGLRLLAEAIAVFEAGQQGELLAEAYRLQGEFLLRQAVSEATQAEACFHRALEVARRQQTKAYELRAAMSLARLWQRQGKQAEAYTLLAPLYGWFTEGFDTADLQEARALLDALG
jgi:tetratricopeptide (TPR) repeat protein